LALPNLTKSFVIEIDASDKGIGAVLQQNGHLIEYVSKGLGPKNQALSTYEKECLAILLAMDQWRAYLQHGKFTIKTDQHSLVHLDDRDFIPLGNIKP
jgi:small ligand-binding sensory domain FIST